MAPHTTISNLVCIYVGILLFCYGSNATVLIRAADSIPGRSNEIENRFTHGIKVILERFTLLIKKLISNFKNVCSLTLYLAIITYVDVVYSLFNVRNVFS